MLSRFLSLSPIAAITKRIRSVANYLIGKIIEVRKPSEEGPSSVAITRILNQHVAIIAPKISSEKTEKQLKTVMNLSGKNARSYYNIFPSLINSEFFLNMNDARAIQLRKKIIPYLNARKAQIDFPKETGKLLFELATDKESDKSDIVSDHLLDLLARALAGINLTKSMRDTLLNIESRQKSPSALLYMWIPKKILGLVPSNRKFHNECETNIKLFLRQQIENVGKVKEDNWFSNIIRSKLAGKQIHQLTNDDLNKLVVDSEVRTCLGVVLGVTNISNALWYAMVYLFTLFEKPILEKLKSEIKKNSHNPALMESKDHAPILYAIYLETLRLSNKDFSIVRYTNEPIASEGLKIPSNSLIIFRLDTAAGKYANDKYPAEQFIPERFLDENGCLNEYARLNQGIFTPFGLGERMCPGEMITKKILMNYIVACASNIKVITSSAVIFTEEYHETIQQKELLKLSFFKAMETSAQENISENKLHEIVTNIASYAAP